jgi:outer membrane murein-binding lipoprotein Lpp
LFFSLVAVVATSLYFAGCASGPDVPAEKKYYSQGNSLKRRKKIFASS